MIKFKILEHTNDFKLLGFVKAQASKIISLLRNGEQSFYKKFIFGDTTVRMHAQLVASDWIVKLWFGGDQVFSFGVLADSSKSDYGDGFNVGLFKFDSNNEIPVQNIKVPYSLLPVEYRGPSAQAFDMTLDRSAVVVSVIGTDSYRIENGVAELVRLRPISSTSNYTNNRGASPSHILHLGDDSELRRFVFVENLQMPDPIIDVEYAGGGHVRHQPNLVPIGENSLFPPGAFGHYRFSISANAKFVGFVFTTGTSATVIDGNGSYEQFTRFRVSIIDVESGVMSQHVLTTLRFRSINSAPAVFDHDEFDGELVFDKSALVVLDDGSFWISLTVNSYSSASSASSPTSRFVRILNNTLVVFSMSSDGNWAFSFGGHANNYPGNESISWYGVSNDGTYAMTFSHGTSGTKKHVVCKSGVAHTHDETRAVFLAGPVIHLFHPNDGSVYFVTRFSSGLGTTAFVDGAFHPADIGADYVVPTLFSVMPDYRSSRVEFYDVKNVFFNTYRKFRIDNDGDKYFIRQVAEAEQATVRDTSVSNFNKMPKIIVNKHA